MHRQGPGCQGDGVSCWHRPPGQSGHTVTAAESQGLAEAGLVRGIYVACPGRRGALQRDYSETSAQGLSTVNKGPLSGVLHFKSNL